MKSNYALQVDIDIAHPKDEHTGIFHGNSASHEVRQNHMNNIYQNLINKIVKNRCNFFNDAGAHRHMYGSTKVHIDIHGAQTKNQTWGLYAVWCIYAEPLPKDAKLLGPVRIISFADSWLFLFLLKLLWIVWFQMIDTNTNSAKYWILWTDALVQRTFAVFPIYTHMYVNDAYNKIIGQRILLDAI